MDQNEAKRLQFKVRQAVGSMAIEGIHVSCQSQATMLRVASGRLPADSATEALVNKYKQVAAN